jgi:septal ring factor EnvC (AmiA/AmiB activator)
MQDSPSIWPLLTGLLGSLAGLAAFLGYLLNRRSVPASVRLITLQGDVAKATAKKTEAERDSIAFNVVSKALQDADRTIEKLKGQRDAADVRVGELLIERQELKEELGRLREQLKLAEEELGLKARSTRAEGKG